MIRMQFVDKRKNRMNKSEVDLDDYDWVFSQLAQVSQKSQTRVTRRAGLPELSRIWAQCPSGLKIIFGKPFCPSFKKCMILLQFHILYFHDDVKNLNEKCLYNIFFFKISQILFLWVGFHFSRRRNIKRLINF